MDVADIRDRYLAWNHQQLEQLLNQYDDAQQAALKLIPLLIQVNHRLLPGYHSPDTLTGIYKYRPDQEVIQEASRMNRRFSYDEKTVHQNPAVDSVFLQSSIFTRQLVIWVVASSTLARKYQKDIDKKLQKITNWLKSRGIDTSGYVITEKHFREKSLFKKLNISSGSSSLFLDAFYAESYLMTGKYPVWWLVPPDKETEYSNYVTHLDQARYVNPNEYINIGGITDITNNEILDEAMSVAISSRQEPESTWLKLLLLEKRQRVLPRPEGVAWKLKKYIYSADLDVNELTPLMVYGSIFKELIDDMSRSLCTHEMPLYKLIAFLWKNVESSSSNLLMVISGENILNKHHEKVHIKDAVIYLNLYKALFSEINLVYKIIVDHCSKYSEDNGVSLLAKNIQLYFSSDGSKIHVVNFRDNLDIVQARILVRHDVFNNQWILYIGHNDGREQKVSVFGSLLSLISWAWLNKLVDQQTQISIDCPLKLVKQTEVRDILMHIIRDVDYKYLMRAGINELLNKAKPVSTVLFINYLITDSYRYEFEDSVVINNVLNNGVSESNLVMNCEQLIVDSWGNVEVRQYQDSEGVLQCICDWLNDTDHANDRATGVIKVFGYSSGKSTYMSHRIKQIYDELIELFYLRSEVNSSFIVNIEADYYSIVMQDGVLRKEKLGNEQDMLYYLEQVEEEFRSFEFDTHTMPGSPINYICRLNKPDCVQMFFRLNGRKIETYVLDEKGALWIDSRVVHGIDGYIIHWLLFMKSSLFQLKKIKQYDNDLHKFEIKQIVLNSLGMPEMRDINSGVINSKAEYIDIKVTRANAGQQGERNINIYCNGEDIDSGYSGADIFKACSDFIKNQLPQSNRKDVFVTGIDVPVDFYGIQKSENIHTSHLLRYKSNIEKQIIKSIR